MKRIVVILGLLLATATTVNAETCVGIREGAAGYYNMDDFKAISELINRGAGAMDIGTAVQGMILTGRAVEIVGVKLIDVEIRGGIAVGSLPNGRAVVTFSRFLRCK